MTAKTKERTRKKSVTKVEKMEELNESLISPEERLEMIAEAAYYRAEQRGFEPGGHMDDWLEAEKVIDDMLYEAVKEANI